MLIASTGSAVKPDARQAVPVLCLTLQIRSGQGYQHRIQPQLPSSASGCSKCRALVER
jgi:hypothetical protein